MKLASVSLSFGVITEVKLKVKKEVKKGLGVLLACFSIDQIKVSSVITPQAWLIEEGEEENNGSSSLAFSRRAPIPVKNILTRVVSDEHSQTEDASSKPCFHICSKFHQRMKVDILILSKGFDCRLSIRTCKTEHYYMALSHKDWELPNS